VPAGRRCFGAAGRLSLAGRARTVATHAAQAVRPGRGRARAPAGVAHGSTDRTAARCRATGPARGLLQESLPLRRSTSDRRGTAGRSTTCLAPAGRRPGQVAGAPDREPGDPARGRRGRLDRPGARRLRDAGGLDGAPDGDPAGRGRTALRRSPGSRGRRSRRATCGPGSTGRGLSSPTAADLWREGEALGLEARRPGAEPEAESAGLRRRARARTDTR